MDRYHPNEAPRKPEVERQVERMLAESQSFSHLDGATQAALKENLARITGYLADNGAPPGLAGQLAPLDLRQRLSPQGAGGPAPAAPTQPEPTSTTSPAPSQSAVGRVGDVSRATLNAINFPEFVASLIKGTFQAIVDASIQPRPRAATSPGAAVRPSRPTASWSTRPASTRRVTSTCAPI